MARIAQVVRENDFCRKKKKWFPHFYNLYIIDGIKSNISILIQSILNAHAYIHLSGFKWIFKVGLPYAIIPDSQANILSICISSLRMCYIRKNIFLKKKYDGAVNIYNFTDTHFFTYTHTYVYNHSEHRVFSTTRYVNTLFITSKGHMLDVTSQIFSKKRNIPSNKFEIQTYRNMRV